MGTERKKYVMPVELAMRREKAYREKQQELTMVTGATATASSSATTGSSKDTHLPSQVPRPTLSQSPTPSTLSMPTPNPCPGPTLRPFPHQRPCPYSRPGPHPRPSNPMPLPTPGPGSRPGPTHSVADHHNRKRKEQPKLPQPEDFFCNICQVDCTSEFNLRMHFKGHKHKAKLKEKGAKTALEGGIEGEAVKKKKPHCELCGIFCTDEFSLRQHFFGKNHTLKVLASEKKMKG